jgi:hypothetical protein
MNRQESAVRRSVALTIVALTLCCATSAWTQHTRKPDPDNLLTNPGFETGDFTGWAVSGTSPNYGVNVDGFLIEGTDGQFGPTTVIVHSGTYAGYSLVSSYYFLELSQTVNLDLDYMYSVGLWVGDGSSSGYGDSINITVDGVPIQFTSYPVINPGYQFVGGTFLATHSNSVIVFHIQGSGSGVAGFSFDDFSLTEGDLSFNRYRIAFPHETFTKTLGINNANTLAGYHGSGDPAHPNQGFVLVPPSNFVTENFPGATQTQVVGINNAADSAGSYVDQSGITHGFLDIKGIFSSVDLPGTTFNQLLGLNDADAAAGYWQDDSGAQFPYTYHAGMFTLLDSSLPTHTSAQATGINNSGAVSGSYVDGAGTHGFLLSGATLTTLDYPGSTLTQARGLNNVGQVVGFYVDRTGATHGFEYNVSTQQYRSYDDPYGIGMTVINGINDNSYTVGFFVDMSGNTYGFLGYEYLTVPPNAVP